MDQADDTQRLLEQRALRNVRALVDKLEDGEREDARVGRVFASSLGLTFVFLAILVVCAALAIFFKALPGKSRLTPYLQDVSARIERAAVANYTEDLKDRSGQVRLTFAIRADGTVKEVLLDQGSGSLALDLAADRFVRSAAPFPPFPRELAADTRVVYLTRTFEFTKRGVKPELR
jgi:TonB family protein